MELVRELVQAGGDFARRRQRRGRGCGVGIVASERLELERQQQHALADVVVQLAGDSRPLGLLGPEEAGAKIADAIVAPLERLLGAAQSLFGLLPACAL